MIVVSPADLWAILPELCIMTAACIVLVLDPLLSETRKEWLMYFTLTALVAAFAAAFWQLGWPPRAVFYELYALDGYGTFWKLMLIFFAGLIVLLAKSNLEEERFILPEFYAFVLLSLSGMIVTVCGTDLLVIYLGLELTSIALYVMAGFKRFQQRSLEAAAKYFILGSISSAILLYGISLIYGRTGSTTLSAIHTAIMASPGTDPILLMAMTLLIVGFGFKVSAVPFHMWTPDVYEGAPTSVTAYFAIASKAAAFGAFARVFLEGLGGLKTNWQVLLVGICIATMVLGNIVAIVQTNIKRMLAYSSIAHAGYALIGLVVADGEGIKALMIYLALYAFMTLGAFAVVTILRKGGLEGDEVADYTGLSKRSPWAALLMLLFMVSLTGIPPTAGFIAKFYIFMAAVNANMAWLAVVAVVFAAISAFFYLRVIMVMYMREPAERQEPGQEIHIAMSPAVGAVLTIAAGGVILLGLFPGPLVKAAQSAILPLK
jgi:NADH-quinone oxidoreductase subunit N